ncbi:phytanoyl-CoA dioxygenase family protein [Yoonia sediminilitoris]|uniref:Ectoine hydroxylase-related dioxygenase (Phytanoyl-CoA dioxygenase family) n=1 Tax=Yoonia sediminilitoris TaxID=1286148 RepID=A0A2T6KG32_9RHOB|nr:phytanoyl-CoA dioxygenase family protein [Yoonia sediminilitoris]PUB14282.1 ectoine hydroxylase-related dioxygenase (phytanoyl-CoA dioxygenase family) [Yoonia sediminilitoris]RCW95213.1 ectoine hydroxylase-related dioxygenase (phytanoyl-CoA dioxygenase family) [Yoonia sediminilitoris]
MAGYYATDDCRIEAFEALISEPLDASNLRFASDVVQNIPVYTAADTSAALGNRADRQALMAEWAQVLGDLSGVVVLKGAVPDLEAVDQATAVFEQIIEEERAGGSGGDHFGERGANDRIWNSLQKLCLRAPDVFARYFAAPAIAAVSEAWLGPWYQMTNQINVVRPGGKAQTCHRDYHLGFMTEAQAQSFPAHAHRLSPALTLQGAVAHCDMPIESGPTKLLPNSQRYGPGYVAALLPAFRALFEERHVQAPLEKGDGLFFNPALFHAAGDNTSEDINRMANLMQIGSPMGRTLERIDRTAMTRALYPALRDLGLGEQDRAAVIGACAEGYPFPTNLDTDPPIGGLASESQAELFARALDESMSEADFAAALMENQHKRLP